MFSFNVLFVDLVGERFVEEYVDTDIRFLVATVCNSVVRAMREKLYLRIKIDGSNEPIQYDFQPRTVTHV